MGAYVSALQAVAVTIVACVMLLAASADLYALERVPGGIEIGPGQIPTFTAKYQGFLASVARWLVFGKAALLVATLTPLLVAVIISLWSREAYFPIDTLYAYDSLIIPFTIAVVSWITFLLVVLRSRYMRNGIRIEEPP